MASVAVVQCGGAVGDHLRRLDDNRESPYPFSFAHQATYAWVGRRWHLGVFIEGGEPAAVIAIGLVGKGKAVTSLEKAINVERAFKVGPSIPVARLRAQLGKRYTYIPDKDGPLTEAEGRRLLAALRDEAPDLVPQIDALTAALDTVVPPGPVGELLGQEKDATGAILEIGGFHRGILRTYQPEGTVQLPFVHGMPQRAAYEDQILSHDAEMFPQWLSIPVDDLGWRGFSRRDGRERIFIANVNHHSEEETLGVDLIYYHEQARCFILVQYKRMHRSESEAEWGYRPDQQMDLELDRMRSVDEKCTEARRGDYSYRLVAEPCWVKLCEARPLVVDSSDLIPGMYLPRATFEYLLQQPEVIGPRGGKLLTYTNVPRYLNNTTFTTLVADGWIGTTGAGTELIEEQINASMQAGRAAVVGVHSSDHLPGNRRRRFW